MNHDTLRKQFNDWLAAHFTPARTANGEISQRSGVTNFDDIDRLRLYLAGSWVKVCDRFRRGHNIAPHIVTQIREIVEIQDPEKIRAFRRDQTFAKNLEHAVSMHRQFGRAPDGSTIRDWAKKVRAKSGADLNERSRKLWREIFPEPAANARRRALRRVRIQPPAPTPQKESTP